MVHEAQMNNAPDGTPKSCFVTLTFDDEHLPKDFSIRVRHWQLFAKKLRHRFGKFKFFACGEYGDESFRPHYHALLFGLDFREDRVEWSTNGDEKLYVSADLMECWKQGFVTIGPVNMQTASYVSRYAMKKFVGPDVPDSRYERIDSETGEIFEVEREFATMSRGGKHGKGLGHSWIEKYWPEVYPADEVIMDGRAVKPPPYYDLFMKREDSAMMKKVQQKRLLMATADIEEQSDERMKVKEVILEKRLAMKKRGF